MKGLTPTLAVLLLTAPAMAQYQAHEPIVGSYLLRPLIACPTLKEAEAEGPTAQSACEVLSTDVKVSLAGTYSGYPNGKRIFAVYVTKFDGEKAKLFLKE